MRFRNGSDRSSIKFYGNLGKSVTEMAAMIRQALGEESMSHAWKVQAHRLKKASQMKSKVKRMLIIFCDIKGVVHKESAHILL
jgi:hypothetical protein